MAQGSEYTVSGESPEISGTNKEISCECCDWTYTEGEQEIILETKALNLHIRRDNGSISYYRQDGTLLLREKEQGQSKELESYKIYRTIVDDTAEVTSVETPDGVKKQIKNAKQVYDRTLYHTRTYFTFGEDEVLYGLGQVSNGRLNLRHSTQYLHQANMKIAIPLLTSVKGYGIFLSTQGGAVFHDTEEGTYLYTEADEMLDYFFIASDTGDLHGVVKGFRKLTGKAVMLPRWAFGYIQSQERFETEEEVLSVAENFRERNIGIDGIVMDWFTWEDGLWGSKFRDVNRFPDPAGMMQKLHDKNLHFMVSIWPNMAEESRDYKEMQPAGHILPGTTLYDAFSEEARKIYWKQANEGWYQYGLDAWWCDSSEAITPEWNCIHKPQEFTMYQDFVTEGAKIMPPEKVNAYGLYHAKGIYEGQRAAGDEKRVLNLTRSGYPGSQKYGTVLWSGDISASWEELNRQIVLGLNFCAAGMPYWTLDIGAFFVKQGVQWYWDGQYEETNQDYGYRELYTRWYQYGAFLPMFRSHGTDCRREPWNFGEPGDVFYDAIIRASRLRYRFMPYIYSLAAGVTREDKNIMNLLAFDFPQDEKVYEIKDQYMFGPAIMVCPVTEPMCYTKGSEPINNPPTVKQIYLPKGCVWFDFWNGMRYDGGQTVEVPLTMEHIPLFVKAGSIIPIIKKNIESTAELQHHTVTVLVYPGQDGSFVLYEDAGDGYGYEQGEYCCTEITYREETGTVDTKTSGDESFRTGELIIRIIK